MKNLKLGRGLALLIVLLAPTAQAQQTASISGVVTDASDGAPLAGANVVLRAEGSPGVAGGAATDLEGRYRIDGIAPGTYTLDVRFVGYQEQQQTLTLTSGETLQVDAALEPGGFDLNDVVVTASRQQEKVLDAPASISVLDAEEIATDATVSSVDVLRNTTGVDMAQTGIDRQEVVLRGFNNAFSGATYVLIDYRQGAIASLGVNAYNTMPLASVDLDRVEVVRGPGSALYGAGVDAGVVHFFSKSPFRYPGTSVAVSGGQQSYFSGQLRHAGVAGEKFGYKIVGQYAQADDWRLDASDPADTLQLFLYHQQQPRDYDTWKYNVSGTLEYRFAPQTTLSFNAGHASAQSVFLSGIGTLQADGFGYSYGQLRLQSGGLFAQAYLNVNDAGNSFVYGGPATAAGLSGEDIVDKSRLLNVQAQYGLDVLGGRSSLIFGADFERTQPETEGTIIGRNEDDDLIQEIGAYAQAETSVSEQLDLTLAARLDYDNIYESVRFSPRAALVFKPSPQHSVRATFNRAFSSPGVNSLFLDIVARSPDAFGQGPLPFVVRGRGAGQGFTFARNDAFAGVAGTDLVAYSTVGCFPQQTDLCGAPVPVGLPLDVLYQQFYNGLPDAATLAAVLNIRIPNANFTAEQVTQLVALLDPAVVQVQGVSQGELRLLNVTTGQVGDPLDPATFSDIEPLQQTTTQTFELGYKGLIGDRLLVALDGYLTQKENFGGPLFNESPFVVVPNLPADLAAAIGAGLAGNDDLVAALQQFGLTPALAAGLLVGLAEGSLPGPNTPVAIVEPTENHVDGQVPELLLTYRNFGNVTFYGLDATVQVLATDRLSVFGNVSWVSDNFFDNEELDEENEALSVALNASAFKLKGGFAYEMPQGFGFNLAGRYTQGFPVRTGPYEGDVDDYFVLDVGAGYDFGSYAPGLRLDVTVQNALGTKHRQFVGAPEIGRLAIARLSYTL